MGVEPLLTSRRSARANKSALMESGLYGAVQTITRIIDSMVCGGESIQGVKQLIETLRSV